MIVRIGIADRSIFLDMSVHRLMTAMERSRR
jgi:hypothetical protein